MSLRTVPLDPLGSARDRRLRGRLLDRVLREHGGGTAATARRGPLHEVPPGCSPVLRGPPHSASIRRIVAHGGRRLRPGGRTVGLHPL